MQWPLNIILPPFVMGVAALVGRLYFCQCRFVGSDVFLGGSTVNLLVALHLDECKKLLPVGFGNSSQHVFLGIGVISLVFGIGMLYAEYVLENIQKDAWGRIFPSRGKTRHWVIYMISAFLTVVLWYFNYTVIILKIWGPL